MTKPAADRQPRSLVSCIAYLAWLVISAPVSRLRGSQAPVDGWSLQTEVSVRFLRYMLDSTLEESRAIEASVAPWANMAIQAPRHPCSGAGFEGIWFGDDYPASALPSDPVMLYIHGGGYSLCSAMTNARALSDLRQYVDEMVGGEQRLRILSLQYSLAPERQFPVQIDEALAAFKYIAKRYPQRKIVVMGDSAGGGLVLALLQKLKDPLRARSTAAVLVSPWVDPSKVLVNSNSDFVTEEQLVAHRARYVPEGENIENPLISPVNANETTLKGMCPLLVHYGMQELFAPDIGRFIEKARSCGVQVDVVVEFLAPHDTPMLVPFFPDMAAAGLKEISKFIAKLYDQ